MPVVSCQCGKSYNLKEQYAGKTVQCPHCAQTIHVPAVAVAVAEPQADPAFDRDVFLLRQKHLSIDERYTVWDEQGQAILFVERPTHLLRTLAAVAAAAGAAVVGIPLALLISLALPNEALRAVAACVTLPLVIVGVIALAIRVGPKRHVNFYRNEERTERLLEVIQDSKWQVIIATYTVTTPDGEVLARLKKNHLYNFFRKKWECEGPAGTLLCTVREDSIILSLLRRLIGPLFGILRTNFIILAGDTDRVIGEFNRKFTLLDRYSLDMKGDPTRSLDRRIAVAIGVMLDTGERR